MTQSRIRRWAAVPVLALLLAAALLTAASAVSVDDFADVPGGAWYYDAVKYVTAQGLFQGTGDTAFSPNGTMTRGMFVTVLGRYAGVDPDAWRAGTVTASSLNLRSGPGTGYSVVTAAPRGASVTLLGQSGGWYRVRYGSVTGYASGSYVQPAYHRFSDVDYAQYYAGYVIWGYEKGIVSGMDENTFAPGRNVTREQICKLLYGYAAQAGLTLADSASAVSFSDAGSVSSWAAAGVEALRRAGVVTGSADGTGYAFRPASSATRAETAAIFQRFAAASAAASAPAPAYTAAPAPTAAPAATQAPAPTARTDAPDTPAQFIGGTVSVPARTLRVGIFANTRALTTAVAGVTLENTSGGGFAYGAFSGRSFQQSGQTASASVTVTVSGGVLTVRDGSGAEIYAGGGPVALRPLGGGALTRVNGGYRYFGDFELRTAYGNDGALALINYVDVEDYVKGVIPYEYSPSWPEEALKAAAVTARNFAMTQSWSTYEPFGFDMPATSGAQTYLGRRTYDESYFRATDAAVEATRGQYLTYNGGLCVTNYFSSDGGATEDAAHVWGTSYAYLTGKADPYEQAAASLASNYTYSITLSRTGQALTRLAQNAGLGGTLARDGIRVETYPATGNVMAVTLTGENGRTVSVTQSTSYGRWSFLSDFGFTAYSYRYSVSYAAASDSFTCTRLGWGHNVGLSQWGAYAMARYYGKSYMDILGYYYTGTSLQYGAYGD